MAALVPAHLDRTTEVLGDSPAPAGLADRAVDRLQLVPALLLGDLGEVAGGEGVLELPERGQRAGGLGGERGGRGGGRG